MADERERTARSATSPSPQLPLPCSRTQFDETFQYRRPREPGLRQRARLAARRLRPRSGAASLLHLLLRLLPVLEWLPRYRVRRDLPSDLVAGLTVAIMHIPQGMAYALLGGVQPIVGLYMAFFPVLLYVLMGTSRHISMGTFAVVCMMASKAVDRYARPPDLDEPGPDGPGPWPGPAANGSAGYSPEQVVTALCLGVGVWQVLLGLLRLGAISVFLSEPLVSGFTTGAAVHVLSSQVKSLLGARGGQHTGPLKIVHTYVDLARNLHTTNLVALATSAAFVAALMLYNELLKPRLAPHLPVPLPIELLAVIAGTALSQLLDLHGRHNVSIIGHIPTGLPPPTAPPFELVPELLLDSLLVAIVAFSVNMSMASIFARKFNYSVDANQELLASGCSNVLASFFSCIPFAASLSRSLIQQTVGGRTQVASAVSCLLLLLVLLVAGPQFEPLPHCVLAAIVVVALKGMLVQVAEVPAVWRRSRADGLVWLGTFLAVVFIDIDYGLFAGLALSLLSVLLLGQRPAMFRLGRVPDTDIYLDVRRYRAAMEIPRVCIVQVAGGLHFANKEYVSKKLYKLIRDSEPSEVHEDGEVKAKKLPPSEKDHLAKRAVEETTVDLLPRSKERSQVRCVILDMTCVCFVDPASLRGLELIHEDLKARNITLCIAECSAQVYERMVHCDFFWKFPDSRFFPALHDAVLYALQAAEGCTGCAG